MGDSADFIAYLKSELSRRTENNPSYSLRAFARALEVSPSFLSKLLRRQRALTGRTLHAMAHRLAVAPPQLRQFDEWQRAKCRDSAASEEFDGFEPLQLLHFEMLSDWIHYAILELIEIRSFRLSATTVARSLGVDEARAAGAIERLKRLGILTKNRQGRWVNDSGAHTTVNSPFTPSALRSLQRQILQLAMGALDTVPMDERDQSALTFAIASERLPEYRELLRSFRRKVSKLATLSQPRDRVYHLSLSLFPVSAKIEARPRPNED